MFGAAGDDVGKEPSDSLSRYPPKHLHALMVATGALDVPQGKSADKQLAGNVALLLQW
jgi:hypothetical protein